MPELLSTEEVSNCLLCASPDIGLLDRDFHFAQCRACGFVFDNPRPTTESIVRFYSSQEKYDSWLDVEDARAKLWKRRLKKFLPDAKPGTLLDVGAGIGQFLSIARAHFSDIAGTEVSTSAVEVAHSRYGIDLLHGHIEDMEFPEESYDNITMFHVLEHVPEPMQTLRKCHSMLRNGGVLLVCVPNDIKAWTSRIYALVARLRDTGRSSVIGLQKAGNAGEIHLSHFTAPTLRCALERAGFAVRALDYDPFYAASGLRLILHSAIYGVHRILRLKTYQALWAVAVKP